MATQATRWWSVVLSTCGGGSAVAVTGIPFLSGVVTFAWRGLDTAAILQVRSIRLWGVLFACSLVAATVRALLERRWALAAGVVGVTAMLAQPAMDAAMSVDALLAVGEGVSAPNWLRREVGVAATLPEVEFLGAPEGASGGLSARVDGEELTVAEVGGRASRGGVTIRALAVHPAPAFEILNPMGTVIQSGFVQLGVTPDGFIELPVLPHRFYFSDPAPAPADSARRGAAAPEALRLRVQRGKLRVFDGTLKEGEPAAFDGLTLRWWQGSQWLEVALQKRPRPILLIGGALLLLEAALLAVLGRRARQ